MADPAGLNQPSAAQQHRSVGQRPGQLARVTGAQTPSPTPAAATSAHQASGLQGDQVPADRARVQPSARAELADRQATTHPIIERIEQPGGDPTRAAVDGVAERIMTKGAATYRGDRPGRHRLQQPLNRPGRCGQVRRSDQAPQRGVRAASGLLKPQPTPTPEPHQGHRGGRWADVHGLRQLPGRGRRGQRARRHRDLHQGREDRPVSHPRRPPPHRRVTVRRRQYLREFRPDRRGVRRRWPFDAAPDRFRPCRHQPSVGIGWVPRPPASGLAVLHPSPVPQRPGLQHLTPQLLGPACAGRRQRRRQHRLRPAHVPAGGVPITPQRRDRRRQHQRHRTSR